MNSFIWPIDGMLTGTTTLGQSEPRSNVNKMVLYISKSSRTEASQSNSLVSYPEHLLEVSYLSAKMQLAYSTADRVPPSIFPRSNTLWLVLVYKTKNYMITARFKNMVKNI